MSLPILIAKDKNAKVEFFKDDYKIGWLKREGERWLWMVWGSASNLDKAIKIANETIDKKGERPIYLSEEPLVNAVIIQTELLNLKQLN